MNEKKIEVIDLTVGDSEQAQDESAILGISEEEAGYPSLSCLTSDEFTRICCAALARPQGLHDLIAVLYSQTIYEEVGCDFQEWVEIAGLEALLDLPTEQDLASLRNFKPAIEIRKQSRMGNSCTRGRGRAPERSHKRPISKNLITVLHDGVAGVQLLATLFTSTFPVTITGLRWSFKWARELGGARIHMGWAIVIVPDGTQVNPIALANGANFYAPEQFVLAFGTHLVGLDRNSAVAGHSEVGSTKTMRKLQRGDQLVLVVDTDGSAVDTMDFFGVVQFFDKA